MKSMKTMKTGVARWPLREGVPGSGADIIPVTFRKKPPGRLQAYWELMGEDHGFLRAVSPNLHKISDKMYRSSQPAPYQIKRFAQSGLKTIINLRGLRDCGSYYLEMDACRTHGVELVNFRVKSREAPDKDVLHSAKRVFEEIEYPALMHCKSGADRVGIASVLYLFLHEGKPLAEARKQLSLRYGHMRHAKTGILDEFIERYLMAAEATGIDFWDWVDNEYDPAQIKAEFKPRGWANFITDSVLRRE